MLWTVLTLLTLFILFEWKNKIDFYKSRVGKERLKAIVVEYRKEKGPMRNDYTMIPYPYVIIDGDVSKLIRLKYASSVSKPFPIGEEVEVFFQAGILYYWGAYEKGLSKFLPSKWDFWSKE
jgi:hypothetical protein